MALLKVALPAAALVLLGLVLLWDTDRNAGVGLVFDDADLDALRTGLRITRPQFSGTSLEGDVYDFRAQTVEPRDLEMTIADVEQLAGRVTYRDGAVIELRSERARLDIPERRVVLETGIDIRTSDGYAAQAELVEIDIATSTLEATGPIVASGPPGRIEAAALSMMPAANAGGAGFDNEVLMRFTGGVKVTYIPQPEDRPE
ncbi:hypothetical protein GE300_18405 [Rhodobacteraceae bacterium 2CG4]|uniref:Lipopolysaccharide export system protein LptC n=1 Tax=Halovulum marinum TaxID=2662447 RepID=A0A6L5Z679_9RHOB|nr:hypothetical protein [Halovulum marinum]MSU91555.1 hypothetical protein [Halovulum marinum]